MSVRITHTFMIHVLLILAFPVLRSLDIGIMLSRVNSCLRSFFSKTLSYSPTLVSSVYLLLTYASTFFTALYHNFLVRFVRDFVFKFVIIKRILLCHLQASFSESQLVLIHLRVATWNRYV